MCKKGASIRQKHLWCNKKTTGGILTIIKFQKSTKGKLYTQGSPLKFAQPRTRHARTGLTRINHAQYAHGCCTWADELSGCRSSSGGYRIGRRKYELTGIGSRDLAKAAGGGPSGTAAAVAQLLLLLLQRRRLKLPASSSTFTVGRWDKHGHRLCRGSSRIRTRTSPRARKVRHIAPRVIWTRLMFGLPAVVLLSLQTASSPGPTAGFVSSQICQPRVDRPLVASRAHVFVFHGSDYTGFVYLTNRIEYGHGLARQITYPLREFFVFQNCCKFGTQDLPGIHFVAATGVSFGGNPIKATL